MTSATILLTAIRSLAGSDLGSVLRDWRRLIAGLAAGEQGLALVLRMGSDADGPRIGIELHGRSSLVADAATEVARTLARGFRVVQQQGPRPVVLPRFVLVAATARVAGFASGEATQGTSLLSIGPDPEEAAAAWVRHALAMPGLELAIRVVAAPSAQPAIPVQIGVSLPPGMRGRPSAGTAALLRVLFPGTRVIRRTPGWVSMLQVHRDDVGAVFSLPATESGVPGLPEAPPAARPVAVVPIDPTGTFVRFGAARSSTGRDLSISIGTRELQRHVQVVGQTGVGKSTMLSAVMYGWARSGNGFILLDPHGELCDDALATLPRGVRDRIWHIDAGDLENPVPINPFAVDDPVQLEIAVQDIVLAFYKLFDPGRTGIVGPRFESLLTNGLRGLRAVRGSRASLLDVPRIFRDRRLERAIADAVRDPQAIEFWRGEMAEMSASTRSEVVGWFTSKFDRFTSTSAMRGILGSGADALDMASAMDDGRIILVDLSKRRLGEVASDLLGFMFLSRVWTGFLARSTTRPFGVFVDEVQSFSSGSLPAMLSEGRKWGASVVVAHQYLDQLDARLGHSLDGNAATRVVFRTGAADARELSASMGGRIAPAELVEQPDLRAILARSSSGQSGRPHSLIVDHRERVEARTGLDLATFRRAVHRQTVRDLVDPYRDEVIFAPLAPRPPDSALIEEWVSHRRNPRPVADRDASA